MVRLFDFDSRSREERVTDEQEAGAATSRSSDEQDLRWRLDSRRTEEAPRRDSRLPIRLEEMKIEPEM